MRLLRVHENAALSLEDFFDTTVPAYAILPYTWGARAEEVTFENLNAGTGLEEKGYDKVRFYFTLPTSSDQLDNETWSSKMERNRWFTRGWTLQELIAPKHVDFYSANGAHLGFKTSHSRSISVIIGIPMDVLQEDLHLNYSVAVRMSGAKERTTIRKEDAAYCLLGMLDVTMPHPIWRRTRQGNEMAE
ncbi:hypothetical protein EK21DRAFT_115953 [Setomelanomma holmii]|uniref:Uncharacterized protein n=1 Tax=Setomelanomma holmii TaxID=210430 RepID=A0A9P4H411_9PLEO|nr:hypothetical protein EK21DRAFT_115953 [Setomelanomma holmii]